MHQLGRDQRALLAGENADGLPLVEEQKRRQGAARLRASRRDQLRRLENVNWRKVAIFSFPFVDVRQCGIGGAEIDPDLHCATRSRTLNSSFHLRPSRAAHQSCSIPVSVTMVSKDTGTTSEELSPDPKLTSIGASSSNSSP